jgi:DNA-binding transcriptional regulator GbsR (MarR family)
MDGLAKKTGYSLASISTTMKMLEPAGFVQRRRKPGTRKVFFHMEKNLAVINIHKLRAAKELMLKSARRALPNIIAKHKKRLTDMESKQKLKIVEGYYRQLEEFETMMDKWTKDLEEMSKRL